MSSSLIWLVEEIGRKETREINWKKSKWREAGGKHVLFGWIEIGKIYIGLFWWVELEVERGWETYLPLDRLGSLAFLTR